MTSWLVQWTPTASEKFTAMAKWPPIAMLKTTLEIYQNESINVGGNHQLPGGNVVWPYTMKIWYMFAGWDHTTVHIGTSWNISGWWLTYPSEKYESKLGWLFPIYGKNRNVPTTNQIYIGSCNQPFHFLAAQVPLFTLFLPDPWNQMIHFTYCSRKNSPFSQGDNLLRWTMEFVEW